jgi:hypothetical protein
MKKKTDHDRAPANDNGEHEKKPEGKQVAPAPAAGGALTSLAALQTALANVNTAAIIGRTGLPMMLFKSREDSGTWGFGQKRIIPEEGSKWAFNPTTFRYGFICFNGNKVLDERLVSVSQPKPVITELPDTGFPWQEEWSVNMKCISGADAGVEVVFKANTDGGVKAIAALVELVRDRINSGQHDGKIVPIMLLGKDSYQHSQYGKVWFPVLDFVDWMSLEGPEPAPVPKPTPAPTSAAPVEPPRRRRVS